MSSRRETTSSFAEARAISLPANPYFPRSGGMVVDWMPGEMPAEGPTVMMVRDDPASRSVGTIACQTK